MDAFTRKTNNMKIKLLMQYDAIVGVDSSYYQQVYEYLFLSEPDEVREVLVQMHTDIARANNGLFYSKKYNCISPGVFELQTRLEPNVFINRLKNTL